MKVKIYPSKVHGTVAIPSSKSMAHRALICASLAKGCSTLSGITPSKDIEATISCMQALGAKIEQVEDNYIVHGTNLQVQVQNILCDCHESGSTLRFLIPVASLTNQKVTFIGQGRLMKRPMDIYQTLFDQQNLSFIQEEDHIEIQGALKENHYTIPGNVSSQFISGLLFTLPLLPKESTITIQEPFESKSYVDLTLQMLKNFGITIYQKGNTYSIPGSQHYQAKNVHVEGDYSQMAFFGVLASLQSELTITNMDPDSMQGDKAILQQLQNAGAKVSIKNNQITVTHQLLQAQTIDLANCPDLGPILCVLASFCKGYTHFIHAKRLRIKESDRIEAMESELKKWGVDISSTEDTITIYGKEAYDRKDIIIDGHNDHRIVMAMSVFGLCAKYPSVIHGAEAITKSYPTFFDDICKIHGKVENV